MFAPVSPMEKRMITALTWSKTRSTSMIFRQPSCINLESIMNALPIDIRGVITVLPMFMAVSFTRY